MTRKTSIIFAVGTIAGAMAFGSIAAACAPDPVPTAQPASTEAALPTYQLPPCATDEAEQPNCYWDATQMGNGQGKSFIVFNGSLYYPQP